MDPSSQYDVCPLFASMSTLPSIEEKLGNGKKATRVLKTSARQKSAKKSEKIGKTQQTLKNT
jgi:hypothetical protein